MSLEMPQGLRWLSYLAGTEWPEGDEDGLFALAGTWHTAATDLQNMVAAVQDACGTALGAYDGSGREQMAKQFDALLSGDQSVESIAKNVAQIGDSVQDCGNQIEYTKLQIISTLAIVAAEIAWALATMWGAFAVPAIESEAAGIMQIIGRALTNRLIAHAARVADMPLWKLTAIEVAEQTGIGFVQDLAIQGYQKDEGHRSGIDWKQTFTTAAVAGISAGVATPVAHFAGAGLSKLAGGGPTTWWKSAGIAVASAAPAGLAGAGAGIVANGAITGQWEFDPAALIGGVGGGLAGGVHGVIGHITQTRLGDLGGLAVSDGSLAPDKEPPPPYSSSAEEDPPPPYSAADEKSDATLTSPDRVSSETSDDIDEKSSGTTDVRNSENGGTSPADYRTPTPENTDRTSQPPESDGKTSPQSSSENSGRPPAQSPEFGPTDTPATSGLDSRTPPQAPAGARTDPAGRTPQQSPITARTSNTGDSATPTDRTPQQSATPTRPSGSDTTPLRSPAADKAGQPQSTSPRAASSDRTPQQSPIASRASNAAPPPERSPITSRPDRTAQQSAVSSRASTVDGSSQRTPITARPVNSDRMPTTARTSAPQGGIGGTSLRATPSEDAASSSGTPPTSTRADSTSGVPRGTTTGTTDSRAGISSGRGGDGSAQRISPTVQARPQGIPTAGRSARTFPESTSETGSLPTEPAASTGTQPARPPVPDRRTPDPKSGPDIETSSATPRSTRYTHTENTTPRPASAPEGRPSRSDGTAEPAAQLSRQQPDDPAALSTHTQPDRTHPEAPDNDHTGIQHPPIESGDTPGAAHRGECGPLALREVVRRTGSTVVRLPPDPAGPEGMTAGELQRAAGGPLQHFDGHGDIGSHLLELGHGATALVVDTHRGPTDRYGIGAHAYVLTNEHGTITVHDPSTGAHHPAGPHTPDTVQATHAVIYTPAGHPHIVTAADRPLPAVRIGAPDDAVRHNTWDIEEFLTTFHGARYPRGTEIDFDTPDGSVRAFFDDDQVTVDYGEADPEAPPERFSTEEFWQHVAADHEILDIDTATVSQPIHRGLTAERVWPSETAVDHLRDNNFDTGTSIHFRDENGAARVGVVRYDGTIDIHDPESAPDTRPTNIGRPEFTRTLEESGDEHVKVALPAPNSWTRIASESDPLFPALARVLHFGSSAEMRTDLAGHLQRHATTYAGHITDRDLDALARNPDKLPESEFRPNLYQRRIDLLHKEIESIREGTPRTGTRINAHHLEFALYAATARDKMNVVVLDPNRSRSELLHNPGKPVIFLRRSADDVYDVGIDDKGALFSAVKSHRHPPPSGPAVVPRDEIPAPLSRMLAGGPEPLLEGAGLNHAYAGEQRPMDVRSVLDHRDSVPEFTPVVSHFHTPIHYMNAAEREQHRLFVGPEGKLYHARNGRVFDTGDKQSMIFVMDEFGNLYAAEKKSGLIQHSSFFGGRVVCAAGFINAHDGHITVLEDSSGHYTPDLQTNDFAIAFLQTQGLRLADDFQRHYLGRDGQTTARPPELQRRAQQGALARAQRIISEGPTATRPFKIYPTDQLLTHLTWDHFPPGSTIRFGYGTTSVTATITPDAEFQVVVHDTADPDRDQHFTADPDRLASLVHDNSVRTVRVEHPQPPRTRPAAAPPQTDTPTRHPGLWTQHNVPYRPRATAAAAGDGSTIHTGVSAESTAQHHDSADPHTAEASATTGPPHDDTQHTSATPEHTPSSPPAEHHRNDCAPRALREVVRLTGSDAVRVPEGPIGPRGMSAHELQRAAGAPLRTYDDRADVAHRLLDLGHGATALVVDTHRGPADEHGVGAHAYVLTNEHGTIVVHDPGTGAHHPVGRQSAAHVHSTHAVVYTANGRPHTLTPDDRPLPETRIGASDESVRENTFGISEFQWKFRGAEYPPGTVINLRAPTEDIRIEFGDDGVLTEHFYEDGSTSGAQTRPPADFWSHLRSLRLSEGRAEVIQPEYSDTVSERIWPVRTATRDLSGREFPTRTTLYSRDDTGATWQGVVRTDGDIELHDPAAPDTRPRIVSPSEYEDIVRFEHGAENVKVAVPVPHTWHRLGSESDPLFGPLGRIAHVDTAELRSSLVDFLSENRSRYEHSITNDRIDALERDPEFTRRPDFAAALDKRREETFRAEMSLLAGGDKSTGNRVRGTHLEFALAAVARAGEMNIVTLDPGHPRTELANNTREPSIFLRRAPDGVYELGVTEDGRMFSTSTPRRFPAPTGPRIVAQDDIPARRTTMLAGGREPLLDGAPLRKKYLNEPRPMVPRTGVRRPDSVPEFTPVVDSFHTPVHYMDDAEREKHRLFVGPGGKLYNARDGRPFDTGGDRRIIFAMDEFANLYAAQKQSGHIQHSSFFGGRTVTAAGFIEAEDGLITGIEDSSGHYTPDFQLNDRAIGFLQSEGLRLHPGYTRQFIGNDGETHTRAPGLDARARASALARAQRIRTEGPTPGPPVKLYSTDQNLGHLTWDHFPPGTTLSFGYDTVSVTATMTADQQFHVVEHDIPSGTDREYTAGADTLADLISDESVPGVRVEQSEIPSRTNDPTDAWDLSALHRTLPQPPATHPETLADTNICAPLALQRAAALTGSDEIRLPDDPVGPAGMTAAEFEHASGSTLQHFDTHSDIADELRMLGPGSVAVVIAEHAGPADRHGVGAHAYLLHNDDGDLRVIDPSTGAEHSLDSDEPGDIRSLQAVLYTDYGVAYERPGRGIGDRLDNVRIGAGNGGDDVAFHIGPAPAHPPVPRRTAADLVAENPNARIAEFDTGGFLEHFTANRFANGTKMFYGHGAYATEATIMLGGNVRVTGIHPDGSARDEVIRRDEFRDSLTYDGVNRVSLVYPAPETFVRAPWNGHPVTTTLARVLNLPGPRELHGDLVNTLRSEPDTYAQWLTGDAPQATNPREQLNSAIQALRNGTSSGGYFRDTGIDFMLGAAAHMRRVNIVVEHPDGRMDQLAFAVGEPAVYLRRFDDGHYEIGASRSGGLFTMTTPDISTRPAISSITVPRGEIPPKSTEMLASPRKPVLSGLAVRPHYTGESRPVDADTDIHGRLSPDQARRLRRNTTPRRLRARQQIPPPPRFSPTHYMDEVERESHRLFVGPQNRLYRAMDGRRFDTSGSPHTIFVMDEYGNLYAAPKISGALQHSSFFGGRMVTAAGFIQATDGLPLTIADSSGHYGPTSEHNDRAIALLRVRGLVLPPDFQRLDAQFNPWPPQRQGVMQANAFANARRILSAP